MRHTNLSKFFLAGLLVVAGGSATAHDHGWVERPYYPREVVRNYNYVYYPAQQVYYSPDNGNWFWASGAGWQVGARLPYFMNVDLRYGGVPVVLGSARPYAEHVYVERTYGAPWREHHDWERDRHERHEWREWREERREHHHEHGHGHHD